MPVQAGDEPLGRSRAGRWVPVSSRPLKGTGEVRGKPPRRGAWLREHMVSLNAADSTYGEGYPWLKNLPDGPARGAMAYYRSLALRGSLSGESCPQEDVDEPDLPHIHSGACDSRYRLANNRHLTDFVESIVENVGDPADDANESGSRGVETRSENLGCACRESAWP